MKYRNNVVYAQPSLLNFWFTEIPLDTSYRLVKISEKQK